MPMSRNPFASRRATRSPGESWAGDGQMCGCRATDANSTSASVRRASNASGASGQRRASRRFQNGSGSVGSCSRIASPRSRSSRSGIAWTRASCTSRRRIVRASMARRRRWEVAPSCMGRTIPRSTLGHAGPAQPAGGRPAISTEAPDGRSMSSGSGSPRRREPCAEPVAGREGRALVELVELDAGDQLAVASPELLRRRRAAASPGRRSGPRVGAWPRPP